MKNINKILVLTVLSVCPPMLSAAPFSTPVSEIRYAATSTADIDEKNANTEVGIDELTIKSILTGTEAMDGKLVFSLDYKYNQFTVKNNQGSKNEDDVHNISLAALYIREHGKRRHIFSIAPGLYSDMEEITADDLDVTAMYNFMYSKSNQLQWIVGIGYSRSFGDPTAFPIVNAVIQPNEHWQLTLGFPKTSVSFAPSSHWHSYAKLQPNGGKWNLDTEGSNDVNLIYSSFEFLAGVERRLANNLWLGIEAGQSFARELEFSNSSSNSVIGEVDVKDASFIAFNLRYKP